MNLADYLTGAYQVLDIKVSKLAHRTPRGPLIVFLSVTERCNLRCKKCTIWNSAKQGTEPELSREEIFSFLSQLSSMGTKIIALWGGEPLLNKNLFEIIREINRLSMIPYLVTNGFLLNEDTVDQLMKSGLGSISVSMDNAFPEKHDEMKGVKGAFARTCKGLSLLRKMGGKKTHIGINMIICKDNVEEILPMAKLASSLELNWLKFIPVHFGFPYNQMEFGNRDLMPDEQDIESIQRNLLEARKYLVERGLYTNSITFLREFKSFFTGAYLMKQCYAGYLLCNVDSYGNVTQCSIDPRIAGNIRQIPFKDLWKSKELDRLRKDHTAEICGHCWLSCFAEPSFRMSFVYSMKNLFQVLTEISFIR